MGFQTAWVQTNLRIRAVWLSLRLQTLSQVESLMSDAPITFNKFSISS
jgi:hypothetical protein